LPWVHGRTAPCCCFCLAHPLLVRLPRPAVQCVDPLRRGMPALLCPPPLSLYGGTCAAGWAHHCPPPVPLPLWWPGSPRGTTPGRWSASSGTPCCACPGRRTRALAPAAPPLPAASSTGSGATCLVSQGSCVECGGGSSSVPQGGSKRREGCRAHAAAVVCRTLIAQAHWFSAHPAETHSLPAGLASYTDHLEEVGGGATHCSAVGSSMCKGSMCRGAAAPRGAPPGVLGANQNY